MATLAVFRCSGHTQWHFIFDSFHNTISQLTGNHNSHNPHVVPFDREGVGIQTAFAGQAGVATLAVLRFCSGQTNNGSVTLSFFLFVS